MKTMKGLVAVLGASLSFVVPGHVAHADPTPYDVAADTAFLQLLWDRGMSYVPPSNLAGGSRLIGVGRYVCYLVDHGANSASIDQYVAANMNYQADSIELPIFEALSIRTFCPPTPADRSW